MAEDIKAYQAPEYSGSHSAPNPESGDPMHDVTQKIYPDDFYGPNGHRYYGSGDDKIDADSYFQISSAKGRPYSKVTIYRAVPKNIKDINSGDWVTINRQYAKDHGESTLRGEYKILKKTVRARDIFTNGDSFHEWGYWPQTMPVSRMDRIAETNESRKKFNMPPVEQKYASGGSVDESDIASPPPAEETGIDAYHGSPHEFEQFDSSKIGTGEGAQAFGHGLYFAGREGTAIVYRDRPSQSDVQIGKYFYYPAALMQYLENPKSLDDEIRKNYDILERNIKLFEGDNSDLGERAKAINLKEIDKLEQLKKIDLSKINIPKGHMYEVRINAHPDHLLDWDKPLSKQSDYVRKVLEKLNIKMMSDEDTKNRHDEILKSSNTNYIKDRLISGLDPSGANIYSAKIAYGEGRDDAWRSKVLLDAGIKGIKYLDAVSRGAGKGTHNYVVFDDKLINIKRRYEMGGAVPMASGGETGDTQNMPQGISPEQQSLLDQLSRAIDESVARYSDGHAGGSASPARGYQEPTMPGEPSLTRQQEQDYNINRLQDALNRVPAAAHGGAMGYAEGGDVENNPVVQKALSLTSGSESRKVTINRGVPEAPPFSIQSFQAPNPTATTKGYSFSKLNEGEATTQKLADIVRRAIDRHISLPPNERVKNSMDAIKALEPYLGTRKDGSPISLLGKNAKLEKSSKGYKGGEPITLPDGRGIETTGISMLPAYQEGKFNLCPNSGSCKDQCLGKTAGNFYAIGGGRDLDALKGPRLRAFNRTVAFLREPEAFAIRAFDDIDLAKRQAAMYGNHLGVRMNVLSDIHPEVYRPIMENHPDVSFYDYTKMSYRRILPNHHLTYSSTGLTQSDVDNPWTNWSRMRRVLDRGDNVAMVFTNKQKVLPKYVHDSETGKRYDVIDGRTHDFRPLDLLEAKPGSSGVIVGLSNLKAFGEREKAHKDSKGFFVRYDPKTDGDSVKVMPQGKGMTGMTNDGKIEREP
jgi:hypothetical protein